MDNYFQPTKNYRIHSFCLTLLLAILTSCGGNDDDSTSNFSPKALHDDGSKTWQLEQVIIHDIRFEANDSTVDVDIWPAEVCEIDDDYIFRNDGTLEWKPGNVDCDENEPDELVEGVYAYNESAKKITMELTYPDGTTIDIEEDVIELTEDKMVLFNSDELYVSEGLAARYTEETTYIKK